MDPESLYRAHEGSLEDFWSRRANQLQHDLHIHPFGRRVHLRSNDPQALRAAEHSEAVYSRARQSDAPPFELQIVVHAPPQDPGPPPEDLVSYIQYSGAQDWLSLQFGAWGACHAALDRREAIFVLSPSLAARPDLVSAWGVNTVLNNLFTRHGYAMLHAGGLVREGRVLLLMAPHGAGKSTTAFHLAHAGYRLLADSQVYLTEVEGDLQLTGFPVGRIKLRPDALDSFPGARPFATSEHVRGEEKQAVDVRAYDRRLICDTAVIPAAIDLCLLSVGEGASTHLEPVARDEILPAVMANSLHYDSPVVWEANLRLILQMLDRASCYRLEVGADPAGIIRTVEGLGHPA